MQYSSSRSHVRSTQWNGATLSYQDTVVIAGCGPLGLGMVAAAKMKGPERIIALDLSDDRLEVAKRSGADLGINPKKEDAVQKVRDLTGGLRLRRLY